MALGDAPDAFHGDGAGALFAPSLDKHTFSQVAPAHLRESGRSLEHLQDGAPIAGRQVFERLGIVFA